MTHNYDYDRYEVKYIKKITNIIVGQDIQKCVDVLFTSIYLVISESIKNDLLHKEKINTFLDTHIYFLKNRLDILLKDIKNGDKDE